MSFNDPRDINRDVNYRDPGYVAPADDAGWGLPIAILAVIVIVGGLFYYGYSDRTQTAENMPNAPITRTAPPIVPPAPGTPAPAPATAPPQQ